MVKKALFERVGRGVACVAPILEVPLGLAPFGFLFLFTIVSVFLDLGTKVVQGERRAKGNLKISFCFSESPPTLAQQK